MVYPYLIFYSTYVLAGQVFIAVFIRSDFAWAIASIVTCLIIFHALFSHWIWGQRAAFPNTTMHFLPAFAALSFNPYTWTFLFGKKYTDFQKVCQVCQKSPTSPTKEHYITHKRALHHP
jgi:hypothetical protein